MEDPSRAPKASLAEVMEVMTEEMRGIRSGRANLDKARTQTGVCNCIMKGMLLDLHERMFTAKVDLKQLEQNQEES